MQQSLSTKRISESVKPSLFCVFWLQANANFYNALGLLYHIFIKACRVRLHFVLRAKSTEQSTERKNSDMFCKVQQAGMGAAKAQNCAKPHESVQSFWLPEPEITDCHPNDPAAHPQKFHHRTLARKQNDTHSVHHSFAAHQAARKETLLLMNAPQGHEPMQRIPD